jgi:polyhydroxybutyrate depolymerase
MLKKMNYLVVGTWVVFSMMAKPSHATIGALGPYLINVDETRKPAEVFLPKQYKEKESWPLIILLHGYKATGKLQDLYFGMHYRASEKGFVLLVPEGTKGPDGNTYWNATDACCDFKHTGIDDANYILGLIKLTQAQYRIDPRRIYILGHSNGGFMAHRLACENAGLFAGIASLAGMTFTDPTQCNPSEPVSVLQIDAINDPTIHYLGVSEGAFQYPSGPETVSRWTKLNGCVGEPVEAGPLDYILSIPGKDTMTQRWSQCNSSSEVAFWTIKEYTGFAHYPHIPILTVKVTNDIIDFLMSHHK